MIRVHRSDKKRDTFVAVPLLSAPLDSPIKGYRESSDTENSVSTCGSSPGGPWLLRVKGDAQLSRRSDFFLLSSTSCFFFSKVFSSSKKKKENQGSFFLVRGDLPCGSGVPLQEMPRTALLLSEKLERKKRP